jgi:hypothetical protein
MMGLLGPADAAASPPAPPSDARDVQGFSLSEAELDALNALDGAPLRGAKLRPPIVPGGAPGEPAPAPA